MNRSASWTQQDVGWSTFGFAVQFVEANNGWARTDGSILHSTKGGTHWSPQYMTSANKVIFSIPFVNPSNGWVVVDSLSSDTKSIALSGTIDYFSRSRASLTAIDLEYSRKE